MPSAIASIARQAQDARAQSLSTLMATLDSVQASASVSGNLADNVEAKLQSAEAAVKAVIIEMQPSGKALLQIVDTTVEATLPPELMKAALGNPDLLKPGTTLTLPASLPVRPAPPPATLVSVSGGPAGTSVGSPPPLANPFPAGTLGAVISRLTGIAFPQAEPVANPALAANPAHPALRPGMLAQPMPAEIAGTVLQAASRQMPLAPALTQIVALAQNPEIPLPADVRQAIQTLQFARPVPETIRSPEGLRNAVARSGLFMEANLAQAAAGGQPFTPDLKSILLTIRTLLGDPGTGGLDAPGTGMAKTGEAAASRQTPAPESNIPRNDALRPSDQTRPELARTVEGALERVKLMQLASLPDHPEMRITDDRAQGMRLALSIPVALNGPERAATAVMGLVIEHQPLARDITPFEPEREANGDTEPFPWKIRLALDLEETGPVQAEIALRGQAVAVTLWAERPAIASTARDEIGALHDALTGAAFDVLKLEVRDGRPQATPSRTMPVVDRRT
jgi:hypothetical protein